VVTGIPSVHPLHSEESLKWVAVNWRGPLECNFAGCPRMSEKDTPTGQPDSSPPSEMPEEAEEASETTPASAAEEKEVPSEEEALPEEKPEKKEKRRPRVRLTALQAAVLEAIRERAQRPRAIQHIIQSAGGVLIPRNDIIRCLNELKRKGLVEKVTKKAWKAK